MTDQPDKHDLDVDIPVPTGLKVTGEEPYSILVVSELAGSDSGSLSGPLADRVVEVTADTFDEVMAAACPTVSWKSTDPVAAGNVMVAFDLRFDSIRAFDPKNLVGQIPAANTLMTIRDQLVERMHGKLSADQLSQTVAGRVASDAELSWLAESLKWRPATPAADPNAVDDLLGQLDLGDGDAGDTGSGPKTPIGAAVAAAAGAGATVPTEEASAMRRTLAEIDRRVSAWLTAVLHSPEVQQLESAWRSLAFLVSRIEFRKGIRLLVLHAPRAQLTERFGTLLIDPVFDEGADAPDLIVADTLFSNSAADLEVLDELAQHGASLPAVVLAGVSAGFFGIKHAWQVPTLPPIISLFDQYQFAKWKTLRQQFYARSLGVVFGRCLLRGLHGDGEARDLAFHYREECMADKDLVWASGALAAACNVARSMAESGWPSQMSGYAHGRLEGLATATGGPKGDKKFGPTDTTMPQPKIEELGGVGLNAAVGVKDHDDALIWNGLTAAHPRETSHEAFLEVSLPYQLFASRLAILLFALKPHLSGLTDDQIVPFVTQHVGHWLKLDHAPAPEEVNVQTQPPEDDPSGLMLAVTVTPPQTVLPGAIPVVLGYQLR